MVTGRRNSVIVAAAQRLARILPKDPATNGSDHGPTDEKTQLDRRKCGGALGRSLGLLRMGL